MTIHTDRLIAIRTRLEAIQAAGGQIRPEELAAVNAMIAIGLQSRVDLAKAGD